MKKFYLSLLALVCAVGAWADVLPTETLRASSNLPTGTPEYQFYIRQTMNGGQYWTATTTATADKSAAGKFAFYAVPGLTNCYYVYNVDQGKWLNYSAASDNMADFASLADNFNANAYWEITESTLKDQPTVSCYQMRPTKNTVGNANADIKSDRYANWNGGASADHTLGLWQQGPTADAASAWSVEAVEADNAIKMAQEIAYAKRILEAKGYAYTKGDNILTSDNVTTIISSPYSHASEGSIANLLDGDAATYWHSDWSSEVINGSHYIVADISGSVPEMMSFTYKRRSTADNDHTTRWAVYGVPADETGIAEGSRDGLTLLAVISTPFTTNGDVFEDLPPFQTKGFKKFRFYSERSNYNRGYFHIGEFQLNGMTEAEDNPSELKSLAAALATAEAVQSPTQTEIDALKAVTGSFSATADEKTAAQALLDKTGVGYPSATAAARVALANALGGSDVSAVDLQDLVAAYKASTEIALPENGKAYTFAFVDKSGNEYKIGAAGTTLSANAEDAAVFYCRKFTNVDGEERYAFVSSAGDFLAYNTLKETYTTHVGADKRLQNDFTVASMVGSSSTHIDAGTKENLFGTVYLTANNRTLESTGSAGAFILKIDGTDFNRSNEPYFSDDYVSAIKVTEISEYTASADVLVAASTINPLVAAYRKPLGANVNAYTGTYGETDYTSFDAWETAINAATSVIADNAFTIHINMPASGFYRIKSMNSNSSEKRGKYVQNTSNDSGLELNTSIGSNSVFYIDGDKKILSFASGQYLNDYSSQAAVGTEGGSWRIVENNNVIGAYALQNPSDNNYFLSDWLGESNTTYGQNDGNAAWAIEVVEWLPVPMNASAGYATLYSPVSLDYTYDSSEERVKAYTVTGVSSNNSEITLQECENGIPADEPVILKYVEGGTIDEDYACVFLHISSETITAPEGENKLLGTFAATNISDPGYVLAKPEEREVALYKAAMSDEGFWKNNGFKAYLPASALNAAGGEAVSLIFNFGTETGIGNIESTGNAAGKAVIYDLSGRRVKSAQKGIFIINGKKVVK